MLPTVQPGSSEYLKLLGYRRYHYRWWPALSPRLLLLLHGRGESADTWTALAGRRALGIDTIAMDLRGHGGTPWDPDGHYDFSDFVDDLALQLRHWKRPCVLAGCGLGARIALAAALEAPDAVDGLILIDAGTASEAGRTLSERLMSAFDDGLPEDENRFRAAAWRAVYRDLTWAAPGGGRRLKCDPTVLGARAADDDRALRQARAVRQPALVVSGSDSASEQEGARLAAAMPRARCVTALGGRWPHIEAPRQVARLIREFLDGLEPARPR